MAGLVAAIHAAPPQRRVWYWRDQLQRPTNAGFFAFAGCLRALDAPSHVGGRDKPGHDASNPGVNRWSRFAGSPSTGRHARLDPNQRELTGGRYVATLPAMEE